MSCDIRAFIKQNSGLIKEIGEANETGDFLGVSFSAIVNRCGTKITSTPIAQVVYENAIVDMHRETLELLAIRNFLAMPLILPTKDKG